MYDMCEKSPPTEVSYQVRNFLSAGGPRSLLIQALRVSVFSWQRGRFFVTIAKGSSLSRPHIEIRRVGRRNDRKMNRNNWWRHRNKHRNLEMQISPALAVAAAKIENSRGKMLNNANEKQRKGCMEGPQSGARKGTNA